MPSHIRNGVKYEATANNASNVVYKDTTVERALDDVKSNLSDLQDDINRNRLASFVDISGYTSGNPFVFPSDGYIELFADPNATVKGKLVGANGTQIDVYVLGSSANSSSNVVLVRKGMKYYTASKSGSNVERYFELI